MSTPDPQSTKYRTILLFGAPGSGKGTQGKILGAIPNLFHFACGDAFRNLRIEDPMGRLFVEYSSKGQLVPDEPTVELWAKNIKACTLRGEFDPVHDTLVLDGIPRNFNQAKMLQDTLDVKAVFFLSCPDQDKMIEAAEKVDEPSSLKTEYQKGDKIKVNNGAFQNFEGEVDEIIPDKGMVRIITTIFGRPTPLELEYWQIEKL